MGTLRLDEVNQSLLNRGEAIERERGERFEKSIKNILTENKKHIWFSMTVP